MYAPLRPALTVGSLNGTAAVKWDYDWYEDNRSMEATTDVVFMLIPVDSGQQDAMINNSAQVKPYVPVVQGNTTDPDTEYEGLGYLLATSE